MRRVGIVHGSAREQVVRHHRTEVAFSPLPAPPKPAPFRITSQELDIPAAEKRVMHFCGDTGGVADPQPQAAVVGAMLMDMAEHPDVAALYHLGDIGYFGGEQEAYEHQLFEAYAHYPRHILGIPGNHDGSSYDMLANFMKYFCDSSPRLLPEVEEFNRDTMTQPNCYWTLLDPCVTIIGLYSNVPSGGVIQDDQKDWLVGELEQAPEGVPLVVALHHPPISVDTGHGGSQAMAVLLDQAYEKADRWPEIVLSGHVHNYQRFTRNIPGGQMLNIVCGNGGYHNLHALASDATAGSEILPGITLNYGDSRHWGFLRLEFAKGSFSGEYVQVGAGAAKVDDRFSGKLV